MPKKLKVHANERVDIGDFVRAANDYTSESLAFNAERSLLDRRARILDGFRVEIADQAANPGQITVFNGNAFDRDGKHLNNEDQANVAKTITLAGATQTFFIEIEFIETETDSDARAFWDPTFDQTAPTPDGQEFSINATTRINPDWRIVTPVSTTAFDATSNPDSNRIPLMVLVTDASNLIDATAPGGGFTQVFASTVLELDILSGVSSIRVLDARLFPDTGTFNLDVGAASVEGPFSITSVDRVNGIIVFAGGPTASTHNAGAIVRMASGVARFVPERTAASESFTAPTQPDVAQRIHQADEIRGSALATSKETFGSRDDLQLRSMKDQIDFLSAQIRELKFGALRSDVTTLAPPSSFVSTRYFDAAGGVQGARNATVTIGDGSSTFGDFNGTDEVPFIAAVAALPAAGGTIYIKAGTYTFLNKLSIDRPVNFVGEFNPTLTMGAVADPLIEITTGGTAVGFKNMTLIQGGGTTDDAISVIDDGLLLDFDTVVLNGNIAITAGAGTCNIKARRLSINGRSGGGGIAAISCVSTRTLSGHIEDSNIIANIFGTTNDCIRGTISDLYIENTQLQGTTSQACIHLLGASDRITLHSVRMSGTQMFTQTGGVSMTELHIDGVTITSHVDTTGVLPLFDFFSLFNSRISHVVTSATLIFIGSGSGDPPEVFSIESTGGGIIIENCDITADAADFVKAVGGTVSGTLWIRNNSFTNMHRAIDLAGALTLYVDRNVLVSTGANGLSGIRITSTSVDQVLITGNQIQTGSGVNSIGIHFDNPATTWNDIQIKDNNIQGGNLVSTTGESKGVEIQGIVFHGDISNNFIHDIRGGGSALCTGIHMNAQVQSGGLLLLCNNRFRNIGNAGAAVQAEAIQVTATGDLFNTSINGNIVETILTTSIRPAISTSYSGDCVNLQICHNTIQSAGGTTTGNATRGLIEVAGGGGGNNVENLNISDNIVDLSFGSITGILVALDVAAIGQQITIAGNTIRCNSTTFRGISITSDSGTGTIYRRVNVHHNTVTGVAVTLVGVTACIELFSASFDQLEVSNNIVVEATFDVLRVGIRCESTAAGDGISVLGNDVDGQTGNRSFTGKGIVVDNFDDVNISNNNVRWIGVDGGGPGIGIEVLNGTRGVVSGNTVLPMTGAGDEITATSCTQMFAVGNSVGNTVNPGTIGWTGTGMVESTENNLNGT